MLTTEHDTAQVETQKKPNPELFLVIMRWKPEWTQWPDGQNVHKQKNDPQMADGSFLQSTWCKCVERVYYMDSP